MNGPDLLLVGGCHRDVIARTSEAFRPGTSCPGAVRETAGGVARNVAVLAASAGLACAFAGRVGDDTAGRALKGGLAAAGIDVTALALDPDAATGTYVAVHDAGGEMVAAVSDLGLYDRILPPALAAATPMLEGARLVFADANLPEATLAMLGGTCRARLAVDAISRAKAARILAPARAGALAFLNLAAASALAGREIGDTAEAARAVAALGVRRAVVTGGARAVAVLDDGDLATVPVPPAPVTDETGAGDALTAGTLVALLAGRPLAAAVAVGVRAAGAALAATGALDRLPPSVLQAARPASAGDPP